MKQTIKCENPECIGDGIAKHVMRLKTIPKSKCQAKLLYERKCVCNKCREYLQENAPFKWEKLSISVEEQISSRKVHTLNK